MSNVASPKKRVLIAEDDPVSRAVLKNFLLKSNYEVTVASDGIEALKILEQDDTPRLAVLDWMMPGMEGVQICERIRMRPDRPYIYVLLLTARTEKEDLLQGLKFGADDYLTKPFDAEELRARLHVGERILSLQDSLISAREELRVRATHDALTGTANRAAVMDVLRAEFARQIRDGRPLGIVLLDIDHFKNINDTHGHLCGDEVLQEVARRMKKSIRPFDTVGRYGGEEFLIVIAASDAQSTFRFAERIRTVVSSTPIYTAAGPIDVTTSLGVAVSMDAKSSDAQTLLRLADEALYRAKNKGRNRSELAIPEGDSIGNSATARSMAKFGAHQ